MAIRLKPVADQVIVITGASSGIGLATARMAAQRGARLVLAARSGDALHRLADEIKNEGGHAIPVIADVGREAEVREIARAAIETFGGFDTWVNNAGVGLYGRLEKVAVEDMRHLFETNVWGLVYGSLEAVRHLKQRGGALINVGSTASERAVPLQGIYSASKHAIKGFTDALRMELEDEGAPIAVTLVKPGAIDTPFTLNAKNYLGSEPQHVPPVYAPETVAKAILHCAETPTRDVFVGAGGKGQAALGHYAPRMADRFMESSVIPGTPSGRPPRRPRDDNGLDHASGRLDERGNYPGHVARSSLYTQASLHPALAGAALAGVGLALAAGLAFASSRRGSARTGQPAQRPRPGSRVGSQRSRTERRTYVRYSDDVEEIEPGEQETFDRIIATMAKGGQVTRERYGHAVRTSHAKAHGLLKGELRVRDGLPPELRQGLFAQPRSYPVIVRLAHVPGEFLDDRRVSTPRGMALKVLDVDGEMLPGHEDEATQDFVLDTGKVFIAPGAKTFLAQISATEASLPLPEGVKQAVSTAARAGNAALHAVGLDSANLDFYGHPFLHPLAEAYFSQCPIRYGDYIAKLSVRPVSPGLRALIDQAIDPQDENGLRTAVVEYLRTNPAEFEIGIQLCTDLDRMPVENANMGWPEDESPHRTVARLILPPQDAYSAARQAYVDDELLFCPAHSLAAHRPLGSIMRARMKAYEVLGRARREQNGRPVREPRSIAEMPD